MKIKKLFILITVLILCFASFTAFGDTSPARFPEKGQQINDSANLFSQETIVQTNSLIQTLKDKTDISLWIVTVHFLDSLNVSSYAQQLFHHWQLDDKALLVLLSPGEDTFSSYGGKKTSALLTSQMQQHLLSSFLEKPFLSFAYDQAIVNYTVGLGQQLEKQLNIALPSDWRAASQNTTPQLSQPKVQIPTPKVISSKEENKASKGSSSEAEKINLGQIFFIVLFALILFGNKKQRKMATSAGCFGWGCGCGPLGWLFALLGLSKFFDNNKKKDDHIYQ